jgi:hypothetical protein
VWSLESLLDEAVQPLNLKAKALVKAHDKDINSLAIAPNDSLVCSGSQVCNFWGTALLPSVLFFTYFFFIAEKAEMLYAFKALPSWSYCVFVDKIASLSLFAEYFSFSFWLG